MSFLRLTTLFVICLLSTNCNADRNYFYYLQHFSITQEEKNKCLDVSVDTNNAHCAMVMAAHRTLMSAAEAHDNDPELFGQTILQLETENSKHPNNDIIEKLQAYLTISGLNSPD